MAIDHDLVIPDPRRTLAGGAIKPFQTNFGSECQDDLERFLKRASLPEDVPYALLPEDVKRLVWEGEPGGREGWRRKWYGVTGFFEWLEGRTYRMHVRVFLSRYRSYRQCHDCGGARLRAEARLHRLFGRTLPEVEALPVAEAERAFREWDGRSQGVPLDAASEQLLFEIRGRLRFLVDVGLGYLTLGRQSRTLSGGEAQRVTLATALGGSLTSTLYVLDEPSVGLHARDVSRLSGVLRRLADAGNAVVVVEHERALIESADHVIDLGPGPGREGGELVYAGAVAGLLASRARSRARISPGGWRRRHRTSPPKARSQALAADPGCSGEQPQGPDPGPAARVARLRHRRLGLGQVVARRPGRLPEPAPPFRHRRVRARGVRRASTEPRRSPASRSSTRRRSARPRASTPRPTWACSSRCARSSPARPRRASAGSSRRPSRSTPRPGPAASARAPATRRWSCSSCPTRS